MDTTLHPPERPSRRHTYALHTQGSLSPTWAGWGASVWGGWCEGVLLLLQLSYSERWPVGDDNQSGDETFSSEN